MGRQRLFISMALGMCVVLVCEAITVAIGTQKSGIAAVFFVFAFEACFTRGMSSPPLQTGRHSVTDAFHRLDGYSLGLSR